MAMMRASSGAVGELSNRSPLLLDDPECGWRVAAGRVDLFAVELVRGNLAVAGMRSGRCCRAWRCSASGRTARGSRC